MSSPLHVTFVDTSILDELMEVPGFCQNSEDIKGLFQERVESGEAFIISITAIVETGNHISQSQGNRRAAAERFARLLDQLVTNSAPWKANQVQWDQAFLQAIRDGAGTGVTLIDLLGNGYSGGGDLAILVEAGIFRQGTYGLEVDIWTLDGTLRAFWDAQRR
jgi:hypothetical protein